MFTLFSGNLNKWRPEKLNRQVMLYLFMQIKERVTNFHSLFPTFAKELSFFLGIDLPLRCILQPCATDIQPGREGEKLCPAPSPAARGAERSVKLGESQREGYSPSGGVVELACGFQANVYLFAVYYNRVGLT